MIVFCIGSQVLLMHRNSSPIVERGRKAIDQLVELKKAMSVLADSGMDTAQSEGYRYSSGRIP
jgi:hypothetical protein